MNGRPVLPERDGPSHHSLEVITSVDSAGVSVHALPEAGRTAQALDELLLQATHALSVPKSLPPSEVPACRGGDGLSSMRSRSAVVARQCMTRSKKS